MTMGILKLSVQRVGVGVRLDGYCFPKQLRPFLLITCDAATDLYHLCD